ncbi:PHD finger protein 7-like [Tyto alba]|uniref:PHD finger protein 7-like n=1 Tax=Tyto alba TaxID=56313 RepID=UPI001C669C14|nr:PHD finger protein 7-like [Tyto alba]
MDDAAKGTAKPCPQANGADVTVAIVTRGGQAYIKHRWAQAVPQCDLRGAESGSRGRQELPKRPGAGPLRAAASGAQAGPWAPAAGTPVPARPALRDACPGPAEVSCSFPLSFALSPPACMLCGRAEADPHICGKKLQKQGICAHLFCLFFTKKLFNQESMDGVSLKDIRRTIKQASQRHCFVCGESGAAITCCQEGCDRSFHLPCAVEGECVTQYFGLYRSFCWQHRPEQAVEAAPGENTACLICLDPVEDRKTYGTLVCPACKHAWFHRACIQNQAIYAGFFCFQCPHCQNEYRFLMEMLTMGIRIPRRIPSGEDDSAYEELYERHSRCDARECLCPGGRQHAEEQGPWQLLLCCSCAAEGTHRRCSFMKHSTVIWECDSCAGLGTGKRQSTRVPPGEAWQRVPILGLAEPLCSRGVGGTALASPDAGLGGRARDLPASPYSLQLQLGGHGSHHREPVMIGAVPQLSSTRDQQRQNQQHSGIGVVLSLCSRGEQQPQQHWLPGSIGAVPRLPSA